MYALVKRAAEIEGVSLTDFMIHHLQRAAQQSIQNVKIIHLSLQDQKQFADSLVQPYQPNQALQNAIADYEAYFGKK